ncbi:hypothetical protein VTI28DRAFT_1381 [Corynascus sepedonium]
MGNLFHLVCSLHTSLRTRPIPTSFRTPNSPPPPLPPLQNGFQSLVCFWYCQRPRIFLACQHVILEPAILGLLRGFGREAGSSVPPIPLKPNPLSSDDHTKLQMMRTKLWTVSGVLCTWLREQ